MSPVRTSINIENKYTQLYKRAENILFNPKHKLGAIDFFLFIYICNRFADKEHFEVGRMFMIEINRHMETIGLAYKDRSIQNSIYKLAKVSLLIKQDKNLYAVNNCIAFIGPIDTRTKAIQKQYANNAIYLNRDNNK